MQEIVISRHPRVKNGFVADILKESTVVDSVSFAKETDDWKINYFDLKKWLNEIVQKGEYHVSVSDGTDLS